MDSEWTTRLLKDCAVWCSGGTPRKSTPEYWGGSIPWISAKSLTSFFIADSTDRVTESGSQNGTRLVPENTILFIVRGMSLKSEFRMGITTCPVTFNQDLKALVPVEDVLPNFLAYAVKGRTSEILGLVGEAGHGTGVLPTDRIQALEIPLPPLPEQRRIAAVLGALDDKIELNRKMNQTLEAMAQALFKSWFVDFDPVIDNALRASNPIPDDLADKAERRKEVMARDSYSVPEYAGLFPDAFEDSELGSIPAGWSARPLYDCATYINGAAYRAFEPNTERRGLPIIKIAELKAGVTERTKFSDVEMQEKYRLDRGDILFSWSGNPDTSIDTFVWAHGPAWLNQHIFRVAPHDDKERSFVVPTLRYLRPVFAEIARNKQTTGLGHVTVRDMKRLHVVWPVEQVLELCADVIGPLLGRSFHGELESATLATTRDTLLPKLISGEIRVPESVA